jgi:helicase associated protein
VQRQASAIACRTACVRHWEKGFAVPSKFSCPRGTLLPLATSCKANTISARGYRAALFSQTRPAICGTQTTSRRHRICVGLARLSVGTKFCGAFKVQRREGHCCVPTFHKEGDLTLGYWVVTQRGNRKDVTQRRNRKEMSAERRARLNKIGFAWSVLRNYHS